MIAVSAPTAPGQAHELTWPVVAIGVGSLMVLGAVGKVFYDQPVYQEYIAAKRQLQWTVVKYYEFPIFALALAGTVGIAYMFANAKPVTARPPNESPSV
jgi:hypothetical protein